MSDDLFDITDSATTEGQKIIDTQPIEEKIDTNTETEQQDVPETEDKTEASGAVEISDTEKISASKKSNFDSVSDSTKSKNKAPMLNRNLILGISVGALLFMCLFIFISTGKKKPSKKQNEVDVANKVFIPDFDTMAEDNYLSALETEEKPDIDATTAFTNEPNMEEIDRKLEAMQENQVGTAPVYQQKQNYGEGGGKRRPDTRENQMQKNIGGIKGLTKVTSSNTGQVAQAQNIPQQNFNDTYSYLNTASQNFAQNLMSQQGMASGFLGMPNQADANQEFYEKTFGGNNQGEFLPSLSLWQGTYIPAILVSGLDTSLPGSIVARVTKNVYSSLDGKFLLIPQGTLLFAEYNSSVGYGQNRVQIGWTAMIRPDGFYVQLANMPAVDPQGYSGSKAKNNLHIWEYIKGLALVSAISIFNTDINQAASKFTDPYSQNIIDKLQPSYQSIQDKIIDQALNIKPSLHIKAGKELNILVNNTITLPPAQLPEVTQKYVRRK